MEKKDYPILCFELGDQAMLGIMVNDYYQVVQKDVKAVKSVLKNYIQKEYKKFGYYPDLYLTEPKLKVFSISIRPVYRTGSESYPLSYKIDVPIPVIYGETTDGGYECYLPLFKQSFRYFDTNQFKPLVTHFINNYFTNSTPEEIYEYLRYPTPSMDFVTLKVKEEQTFDWFQWSTQRGFKTLNRLTQQVPLKKGEKRNTLPEMAWEREEEIQELIDKLLISNTNVLVVGANGAGKSAVITQAVKHITTKSKAQQIEKTFWQIMPQRITASAKYLGEWQESVELLIEDLIAANGVLWVDQIIQLLMSGGEGAEDSIAAFLIPFLQQGKIQLLGEVTPQELESMRRLLPDFIEYFQLVQLKALTEKQVQTILSNFSDHAKERLKVQIDTNALTQSYRLLLRHYPYEAFPGKGIKFLGRCVNYAQLHQLTTLSQADIVDSFIKQSGLPEIFLRDEIKLPVQKIRQHFEQRIIGQDAVIEQFCNIIKIYKAGLNDPNKPISTMLFAGPTGVGKTASAKALSQYFFGEGKKEPPLIRIDMSEFQHPNQVIRFIGIGKEVGQLVKSVREKPFAVVLLDEVEKAHPSIFDALLTVLDEGILVDHFGRLTNFRNTIIIMTTNLGASNQRAIGLKNTTSDTAKYESAIGRFFRPEFVNRIDQVVLFRSLEKSDVKQILLKELEELKQREGFVKQHLTLDFSPALIQYIADIGFNAKYGARPLQRAIEQTVTTPMANWLLSNADVQHRKLLLDIDEGKLVIS